MSDCPELRLLSIIPLALIGLVLILSRLYHHELLPNNVFESVPPSEGIASPLPGRHGSEVPRTLMSEVKVTNAGSRRAGEEPEACPISARLSLKTDVCNSLDLRSTTGRRVFWVVVDHIHKGIYIANPKAGTKTMVEFLAHSIGETIRIRGHFEQYYREKGLSYMAGVIPNELHRDFPDYFTYLVVRHPLQKFVSGYYATIGGPNQCRKLATRLGRPSLCEGAQHIPFEDFAEAASKGFLYENHHWSSVQYSAFPCNVTLSMILKTETMVLDGPVLCSHLKMAAADSPGHAHSRFQANNTEGVINAQVHKYDGMLFELQQSKPEVFQWLLEYFRQDMDMFGYGWDPATGSSSCGIEFNGKNCC